ncbi:Putative SWI/SNF-related matrix-associated actin-dependent regulator of chromatin subfamily A member 3-like 1 [Linum perenne]
MEDGDSQDSQSLNDSSEPYLLGFVLANIVGLRYYDGKITGRELVGLVREPTNPYDQNAIRVFNTRSLQVGHIEKTVASVLAPLIDSETIIVEGIVATQSKFNKFKIPVQIHIFTSIENFVAVKDVLDEGGLGLFTDENNRRSDAMIVRENAEKSGVKELDEIFKLVDQNVSDKEKIGVLDPPESVIKTHLLDHQKEGLWWLVNREKSVELPPFWEEKNREFVNTLTNFHTKTRPEPLRGGIFADDMGLGKTLTLLSLVALDKSASSETFEVDTAECQTREEDNIESVSSGAKRKRSRPNKTSSKTASKKNIKVAKSKSCGELGTKTTLIVCPLAVLSNWVTQLEDHTHQGAFTVYIYHGERSKDANELKKHDIVLTTYSTLASEESMVDSPMKQIEWWRVILDEAHVIKNVKAQQSKAVINLIALNRWAVTGTPVQNGPSDMFSLMAFLRFDPFSTKSYWQRLIQRPIIAGDRSGLSRLQVLVATISLRRTKEKTLVGLPSKVVETCYIELSEEDRQLYDDIEQKTKLLVQGFINAGSLTRNYSAVLCLILRLRQICNDSALCPSDYKLPYITEDVSTNPELLKKIAMVLQDGEDFECPICITPPTDTIITCCAHIFCRLCIMKVMKQDHSRCPLCRRELSQADLFSAPPKTLGIEDDQNCSSSESLPASASASSSKVSALLSLLTASKNEDPTTKSVVFSQFQKMLLLLEGPLRAAGFKTLRLDGTMSAKKRSQVMKEFGTVGGGGGDEPTILLASLKASGAGINLTAASNVYLLEPWWNPAVEEQAMDRVHRIGQKKDVKVTRLITRNSIEERVLEMQERKQKMAQEALGGRRTKSQREVGTDDIQKLMSL